MQMATKRPTKYDEKCIKHAVEKILPEVLLWLETDENDPEKNKIIEELTEAINNSMSYDSFSIADELKRMFYWDCDSELVHILDKIDSIITLKHFEIIKEWVIENNIITGLKLGEKVSFYCGKTSKEEVGEITKIYKDTGHVVVSCPHLGHEQRSDGITVHGFVLKFEDVKKVSNE